MSTRQLGEIMADEWKVVTKDDKKRIAKQGRRRRTQNTPKPAFLAATNNNEDETFTSTEKTRIKLEISSCVAALKATDLYRNLKELFDNHPTIGTAATPTNKLEFRDLVCYGVGNFASKVEPRWQLASIEALRELLSIENTYYYDPCTSPFELEVLTELKINVLSENEQGSRPVTEATLFYMPHCPQSLYNNLLLANWKTIDSLQNVFILGNSLHAYADRQIGTLAKGIEAMLPFIKERELLYSKHDLEHSYFQSSFNDCHLVWVRMDSSDQELPVKPAVEVSDDEVIT